MSSIKVRDNVAKLLTSFHTSYLKASFWTVALHYYHQTLSVNPSAAKSQERAKTRTWLPPLPYLPGSLPGLSLAALLDSALHLLVSYRQLGTRSSQLPATLPNPQILPAKSKTNGGKGLELDVNDPTSPRFVDNLEQSGIEIDSLINNAGYSIFAPVESTAEEELRAQMESLYFGPLRLIRAVLPYMRQWKFGVIANFSSGAALDGNPTMGAYAGAKAGLDGKILLRVLCLMKQL